MKKQTKMHRLFRSGLLLIAAVAISIQLSAKSAEKNKQISKNFKVVENQVLEIENQFGFVNITTWDSKEVQLTIDIQVEQKNEDKAQALLDQIEIEIKESKEQLRIRTKMGNEDQDINIDGNKKIEVNYTIKMPASMTLDLENKFGDVTIDKLSGKVDLEVQFGTAKIGSLSGKMNDLTFKFSDPVIIDEIAGGEIELKFSKLNLGKAGDLEFDSQMSNSTIGTVKKGDMKVSYGSMEIEGIQGLDLNSSMSTIKIGELADGGEFDVQYGKLDIDKLSKNFKGLTIDSKFTPVTINVEAGAAFELDANTKMSNLDLPSGYKVEDASEYVNNEYFKGVIGEKGGELPKMKVTNQFGKVEIK